MIAGKSSFIGKGSSSCVFKPSIPCKSKRKNKKKNKNKNKTKAKAKVSKVMVNSNKKNIRKELTMNNIIGKIPNHKEWAYIWTEHCKSPTYEIMKEISEIDKCLAEKKLTKQHFKNISMFHGEYGGPKLINYCLKLIKKNTFEKKTLFIEAFNKCFKLLDSVFKGIVELGENKISHQDLSYGNIIINNNKSFIIDFGISCKFTDLKNIKERSLKQLRGSRIYSPYPYDYIYAFATPKEKKKEIEYYQNKLPRNNHGDYLFIHKTFFNRKNIEYNIFNNLNDTSKTDSSIIIENLDTYSLGIMLPNLFVSFADNYKIDRKELAKVFAYKEIQTKMALLKDMTEYDSVNRIKIEEAYNRFKQL